MRDTAYSSDPEVLHREIERLQAEVTRLTAKPAMRWERAPFDTHAAPTLAGLSAFTLAVVGLFWAVRFVYSGWDPVSARGAVVESVGLVLWGLAYVRRVPQ